MNKLLTPAIAAFAMMAATFAYAADATGNITKIDAPTRTVTRSWAGSMVMGCKRPGVNMRVPLSSIGRCVPPLDDARALPELERPAP